MKILMKKSVTSDYGFLKAGAVVEVDDETARHYNRTGIGEPVKFGKIDHEAEYRQTKIVEPDHIKIPKLADRPKRKYQRRVK